MTDGLFILQYIFTSYIRRYLNHILAWREEILSLSRSHCSAFRSVQTSIQNWKVCHEMEIKDEAKEISWVNHTVKISKVWSIIKITIAIVKADSGICEWVDVIQEWDRIPKNQKMAAEPDSPWLHKHFDANPIPFFFHWLITAMASTISPHAEDFAQQRPFRIRKSLRELIHRPRSRKQQKDLSLPLPSLPDGNDSADDEYVYDILYECQRG